MISRLTGILIEKQPPFVLMDLQGVGYEVQVPMTTFYQLPELQQKVTLYTHFVVREDAHALYGFHDQEHRSVFRQIIKTSGIGPKMGLAILSGMNAKELMQHIYHQDIAQLTKIPGIGKRTAERLLIEMRDTFSKTHNHAVHIDTQSTCPQQEAISALIALGYRPGDALRCVTQLAAAADALTSQELIRLALAQL